MSEPFRGQGEKVEVPRVPRSSDSGMRGAQHAQLWMYIKHMWTERSPNRDRNKTEVKVTDVPGLNGQWVGTRMVAEHETTVTVRLVLKTLTNGIWVFMDNSDTEMTEYDQRHEPRRAGAFHLGRGVVVCTAMHSKDQQTCLPTQKHSVGLDKVFLTHRTMQGLVSSHTRCN